jgi:5-methylcytosine-specific restriction endonuclease McrA
MRVIDYLKAKYGHQRPTTILYNEAKIFGIPYPLANGWLWKHGNIEINPNMAARLEKCLLKMIQENHIRSDSARLGLEVLKAAHIKLRSKPDVNSSDFLQSKAWQRLRICAFEKYGNFCNCCGATAKDGIKLHVDHIKPRRLFPELALDINNLQILCAECNSGKGNWNMKDFRFTNA